MRDSNAVSRADTGKTGRMVQRAGCSSWQHSAYAFEQQHLKLPNNDSKRHQYVHPLFFLPNFGQLTGGKIQITPIIAIRFKSRHTDK